ncbi:hypothetical protein C2845_PM02G18430 [Panicum miliaceum]|uniref:VQ domain-containing protein n=1 Tax=Panicum miliaceum TaxID=4540 RepID=A0A3L6S9U7_PANMI|nr:hypothetical protein C2845_PM02G18430 [Panicum miliaceum]
MKSSGDASGGGRPPHWRRRTPRPRRCYVVHPAQFRTVVQQLTGAAASPPPPVSAAQSHHQGGGDGGTGAAAAGGTNAAARQQVQQQHGRGEDRISGGRTLGQMHQECMAWADADD